MLAIAVALLLGQDGGTSGQLTELMIELNGKNDQVAKRFVHARLGALQACYERELARSPKLEGKITVAAKIMPSDRFDAITVVGDLGNDAVTACVTSVVKGWTWPLEIAEPTPIKLVLALEPARPIVAPDAPKSSVPDGAIAITGVELKRGPKDAFEQYVRSQAAVLKGCYQHELVRNPAARGTVFVNFDVVSGAPAELRVSQDLKSAAFESCVIEAVRFWHFPFTLADRSPAMFSFAVSPRVTSTLDDYLGVTGDYPGVGGDFVPIGRPTGPEVRGKLEVKTIERNGKADDVVTRFVTARLRALQGCYELELKRNPKHKGTVTVQGVITTSGRSSELAITDDLGSEPFDSCVTAILRGWTYPFKPEAPEKLRLVFTVKPAG